jgi:hypothetical protein
MKRRVGWLSLVAWTTVVACGGGSDEPGAGGGDDRRAGGRDAGQESPPAAGSQSVSFSRGTVPMKVTASVDGDEDESSGPGECAGSADASIYDVPATLWRAAYQDSDDDGPRLNLTLWRPKAGGADMVTLSLWSDETTHRISTVKGGQITGSGTAGVRPQGKGGILTVSGEDDHGHAVELSVECERFDEVVAEGG